MENFNFPYCDDVAKYKTLTKVGHGTFGEVFKARHQTTLKLVALKKLLVENKKEGFPITSLREIRILQLLKHENIVNLIEICHSKSGQFFLVFEFCEHDLAGILSNVNVTFSLGEKKMVMKQLFNALYFTHSNKVVHRDMKSANILITKSGVLKLADFGLARAYSQSKNDVPNRYTNTVVTLWYRPPELLLGERNYGPPVDLWGVGCIMAELWTRKPIMQGSIEQEQLQLICRLCGSITPETYSGVEHLKLYTKIEFPKDQKRRVKEKLSVCVKDQNALDLLDELLTIDPAKRIDCDSALNHDFFWSEPLPCDLAELLSQHTTCMFEYLYAKGKNDKAKFSRLLARHRTSHPNAANDGQYHDRVF